VTRATERQREAKPSLRGSGTQQIGMDASGVGVCVVRLCGRTALYGRGNGITPRDVTVKGQERPVVGMAGSLSIAYLSSISTRIALSLPRFVIV
jgi:hypothetical protein